MRRILGDMIFVDLEFGIDISNVDINIEYRPNIRTIPVI